MLLDKAAGSPRTLKMAILELHGQPPTEQRERLVSTNGATFRDSLLVNGR